MSDNSHRTDTLNPFKDITAGKQLRYWLEFQLVDEQGEPLANMPYTATNDATREGLVPDYVGHSNDQGVIRLEELHPLAITLKIQAQPFADLLQTRRRRAERPEPRRPGPGSRIPLYGPQRAGFSPIEKQARAAGHSYHYLRIGELCDSEPRVIPISAGKKKRHAFHFPDDSFGGFTVTDDQLNRRHVLEVCPFRAWSLVLHHQAQYSLANAYNLGLMSILAYSTRQPDELGSVKELFDQQFLDLSRAPRVWDDGQAWPCLVQDVPFNERYSLALPLDTAKADPPEGDTQLFYAVSSSQLLVSWRGTEMNGMADLITDSTFRPVKPEVAANCAPKVPCTDLVEAGSVHLGFRDAYEMAVRLYEKDLREKIYQEIPLKNIFICGHSLGGALGLVHAASLKEHNPLLYTYGMPRTFTSLAVQSLKELWHFRHVNDADAIPRVPPEAALDSQYYDRYGPLGAVLGFCWSLSNLIVGSIFKQQGDPYSHHGDIVILYKAEQHRQQEFIPYPAYRKPDGSPYRSTITAQLPEKSKLYLVPSLHEEADRQAEQAQIRLMQSVDKESRARYFPQNSNPDINRLWSVGDHLMSQYQPYIHNQLLESINPLREPLLERQVQRRKFEQQMKDHYSSAHEDEHTRNSMFLEIHKAIDLALVVTQQAEGGQQALERFNAIADPQSYYEKTYG